MRNLVTTYAAALGLAGALALGAATPLAAAPLSNAAALQAAAPTDTAQVQWRGHRRGHGWVVPGAVIGGLAAGAIIGSQAYRADPYYGGYAYEAHPGYAYEAQPYESYSYAPAYRRGFRSMDRDCLGDYDSGGARC